MNTSIRSKDQSQKSHLKSIMLSVVFLISNQIVNASESMSNSTRDQKKSNQQEVVDVRDERLAGSCLAIVKQPACHFEGRALQSIKGQCSTQLFFKGGSQANGSSGIYAVVLKSADEIWFETYGFLTGVSVVTSAESARVKMAQSKLQDQLSENLKNQKHAVLDHLSLRGIFVCSDIVDRSDLAPIVLDKITYWD